MRWCRIIPLTKLQEEETDPWPRSCRTTSRSKILFGHCRARWNSTVLLRRTNSKGEKRRSRRRSSTQLVHLMDTTTTKRWVRLPAPSPPQATPLYLACCFKSWESALLLLSRGADPNRPAIHTTGSYTPLYWVAWRGSLETARELLKHGARQDVGGENFCDHSLLRLTVLLLLLWSLTLKKIAIILVLTTCFYNNTDEPMVTDEEIRWKENL